MPPSHPAPKEHCWSLTWLARVLWYAWQYRQGRLFIRLQLLFAFCLSRLYQTLFHTTEVWQTSLRFAESMPSNQITQNVSVLYPLPIFEGGLLSSFGHPGKDVQVHLRNMCPISSFTFNGSSIVWTPMFPLSPYPWLGLPADYLQLLLHIISCNFRSGSGSVSN